MGLLDELEQEAQKRRDEEAGTEAQRAERERDWNERLGPAVERLADYLKRLAEQLRFLERRNRFSYPLAGYGEVVAVLEPEFHFRHTPARNQHEIALEFSAQVVSEACPAVDIEGATRVRALSGVFQQHRLSGMQDPQKNANGEAIAARFQARGKIPMKLQVLADQDSGLARMQLVNLEGFGTSSRSFTSAQLDDALFDALGRFVAREDLAFAREDLPEDVRRQLKSRIERDQLKREWEQKLADQARDDERRVRATAAGFGGSTGLLGRIGEAWRRVARR